ncbi:MAG: c-type cytochrome [Akkermansiaceae bacterium]|jgi:cytochrome c|tara:strand:- start:814 stop:1647 length:834 start_codon:yes stop_codon:yes gene_type:complete
MPTQYSNHRDTPLRRFNTFWWGLAYFGIFGLVSAVVYWATDEAPDAAAMRKDGRMKVRTEVDAAQKAMMPAAGTTDKMGDVVKGAPKASDIPVPSAAPIAVVLEDSPGLKLFKGKTCATCHGADAASAILPNYPNLAGQNAEYTIAQLKDFHEGKRTNGQSVVMKPMAGMINEEERKTIATWLAGLEKPAVTLPDGAGKDLYIAKACFSCHGADANTPLLPVYPRLAGQNAQYLLDQMKAIKDGSRANGQSAAMRALMTGVNEEEMKILSEWLAGQK